MIRRELRYWACVFVGIMIVCASREYTSDSINYSTQWFFGSFMFGVGLTIMTNAARRKYKDEQKDEEN